MPGVQWNPVNMATNGPWKFGRINGAGLNFMTGLLKRESRNLYLFALLHTQLLNRFVI